MLIPATYNGFRLFGGDVFTVTLNWKDADGNLIDLTNYHARLRLWVSTRNRALIGEITDGQGIILSDGSVSPNIACKFTDEQVSEFSALPGYLTLEIEEPDGDWQRLLEGVVRSEQ